MKSKSDIIPAVIRWWWFSFYTCKVCCLSYFTLPNVTAYMQASLQPTSTAASILMQSLSYLLSRIPALFCDLAAALSVSYFPCLTEQGIPEQNHVANDDSIFYWIQWPWLNCICLFSLSCLSLVIPSQWFGQWWFQHSTHHSSYLARSHGTPSPPPQLPVWTVSLSGPSLQFSSTPPLPVAGHGFAQHAW